MRCRNGERLSFTRTVTFVRNHYNFVAMTAIFDPLFSRPYVKIRGKTAILYRPIVAENGGTIVAKEEIQNKKGR